MIDQHDFVSDIHQSRAGRYNKPNDTEYEAICLCLEREEYYDQ